MILIDTPRWHGGYCWSHLVSDTSEDELHAFATRIGLKAAWFQGDHYDVRDGRRMEALRAGATQVRPRDVLAALKARGLR